MTETHLKIEGMSCQHCVASVKKAVDNQPGVNTSEVDVGNAKVTFDESVTSRDSIAAAVEKAGYKVISSS